MSNTSSQPKQAPSLSQEDPELLAEFEQRISDGILIEPGDWMPEAYRMGMLAMAEHHANSEIIGALPEGE